MTTDPRITKVKKAIMSRMTLKNYEGKWMNTNQNDNRMMVACMMTTKKMIIVRKE